MRFGGPLIRNAKLSVQDGSKLKHRQSNFREFRNFVRSHMVEWRCSWWSFNDESEEDRLSPLLWVAPRVGSKVLNANHRAIASP